jgi:amidase
VLLRAGGPAHREWLALHEARHRNRRDWARFFQRWDSLVRPVTGAPPLPHRAGDPFGRTVAVDGVETEYARLRFWLGLASTALLPATAVPPATIGDGLPPGAQVVRSFHEDRTTLLVAALLERHWRGFVVPPSQE